MDESQNNLIINNINNQLLNTLDIGTYSLNKLSTQREELINTDININNIDKNLKISDKIITRMNSLSKKLSYLFKNKNDNITSTTYNQNNNVLKNKNILDIENNENKKDIDFLLTNVKKLKQISKIMNTELKLHNNILNSIDDKIDKSNPLINKINKDMNKLL